MLLLCKQAQIQVSPLLEPNDSDNDSPKTFFDTKIGNAFLDKNDKSLAQTHISRKSADTRSSPRHRLSELLALWSQVSDANAFSVFPVLKNLDAQGHIIPQYDGIHLFYMQQMIKPVTMYGPHSPFTEELLNVVASSIGNVIPCDWRTLIKLSLNWNIFNWQCGFMI